MKALDTVAEYIENIPEEKREPFVKLMEVIDAHLPEGFEKVMQYGMISYVVPKSIYPEGYHVDPTLPLAFISLAVQKSHIAVYHMGVYADEDLLDWFVMEYKKTMSTKLDMGKSCIRFKNPKKIPYALIGGLVQKMSVDDWVKIYEASKPN
ncbi:DUF1801 domain-containing protein [Macrococcus animalis]|uniref:DUF1801 domain-containing protein n=1 Tax=Macrococcus animalis TaxID=3395467 RepID=UPI0039BE72DE